MFIINYCISYSYIYLDSTIVQTDMHTRYVIQLLNQIKVRLHYKYN